MSTAPVSASPAATVMLIQDSPGGITVLMVKRQSRGFFGGLMVFPGGGVEEYDTSDIAKQAVPGEYKDYEYRVAALRELAEETGLALTPLGTIPAPEARGEALLQAMIAAGTQFDPDRLVLISRWITPEFVPRRFDTWFYLAEAIDPPPVRLDMAELVDHVWISADEALRLQEERDWKMFSPTIAHLRWLSAQSSVAEAVATAEGFNGTPLIPNSIPSEMT